jgi:hypothetical protein
VTVGRFRTDKNLAVLERNDIRWSGGLEESAVNLRHSPIRDQDNVQVFKISQQANALSRSSEALLEGKRREIFPLIEVHPDDALPITNQDFRRLGRSFRHGLGVGLWSGVRRTRYLCLVGQRFEEGVQDFQTRHLRARRHRPPERLAPNCFYFQRPARLKINKC